MKAIALILGVVMTIWGVVFSLVTLAMVVLGSYAMGFFFPINCAVVAGGLWLIAYGLRTHTHSERS